MKFILGGGLAALLARDILGDKWTIIPYGKSLFYSFSPPICDNYVIKDGVIDGYMDKYALIPIYIKASYSLAGHLTQNHNIALDHWLYKLYGLNVPPHAKLYWQTHIDYFAYGDCLEIYRRLQKQYLPEIVGNQEKYGKLVTSIGDHRIKTDIGGDIEYDEIISTIPIYALTAAMGLSIEFPSRDLWCYHVITDKIDLEGATHGLVADQHIEFYKVTKIKDNVYIFYSTQQIISPAKYFMAILKKFELIGETQFERATPCGPVPNLTEVSSANITCIGSRAGWDDCMDIGTCCKRLIRKANAR